MNIKTIASGSKGNCYIVEHEGERLILECGVKLDDIRKALDFDFSNVAGCLISHEHKDHALSVEKLLRNTPIKVFGPPSRMLIDAVGELGYVAMSPGCYTKFSGDSQFMIYPFCGTHDVECYSYLIQAGEKRLFFASDTSSVPFIKYNAVTHLMIEANHSFAIMSDSEMTPKLKQRVWDYHMDIQGAVKFAKEHKNSLDEVHLLHLSNEHSDEELFKKMMVEAVGVPVYVAGNNC